MNSILIKLISKHSISFFPFMVSEAPSQETYSKVAIQSLLILYSPLRTTYLSGLFLALACSAHTTTWVYLQQSQKDLSASFHFKNTAYKQNQ